MSSLPLPRQLLGRARLARRNAIHTPTAARSSPGTFSLAGQSAMLQPHLPNPTTAGGLPAQLRLQMTIDGCDYTIMVDSRADVLDVLREKLALDGSKKG